MECELQSDLGRGHRRRDHHPDPCFICNRKRKNLSPKKVLVSVSKISQIYFDSTPYKLIGCVRLCTLWLCSVSKSGSFGIVIGCIVIEQ